MTTTSTDNPRLLLIDGHSMAYRAFFALPAENFSTRTGQYTNAVFGFTSMLLNLVRDEQPTHIAVAFDVSRVSFRSEQYAEYKANRSASPEPFKGQVDLVKEILTALNVPFFAHEGVEADDVLATLAQRFSPDAEVLVCTGDRDAFQLINDRVTVLYPVKGVSELNRMTPEVVEAKYGVPPQNYPDLAALVGETSDNLPGVPKVGPKTAAKWIQTYGPVEQILASADQIKGKVGEALREHEADVRRNRTLNKLLTDVPVEATLADLERQPIDREAVHEIFDALEFRTLRDRLLDLVGDDTDAPVSTGPTVEHQELNASEFAAWCVQPGVAALLAVGDAAGSGVPTHVVLSRSSDQAVSIALTEVVGSDAAREHLASLQWASHDAKATQHALASADVELPVPVGDISVAAYLCHPDQRDYRFTDLVLRYLHRELPPLDATPAGQLALDDAALDLTAAAAHAAAARELLDVLGAEMAQRELTALYQDMELPLIPVLFEMEQIGIAVDEAYLTALQQDFQTSVNDRAELAYAAIDQRVNLGSPKQLQEVLFTQLDMPKTKKIKTGYSTDADSLADLLEKTEHPFLVHLLAHREVTRQLTTVTGLLKSIATDGRIHTTFGQTVAATGRLSSTDPNLQNIPIRTEEGRRIRQSFVAGEGFDGLLTADYSQIEMRIMAHLSEDAGLIEAFNAGEDLHAYVGGEVFDVDTADVTAAMRSKVKAMSYGLAYGLSAFGLSKQLRIDTGEASELMHMYFERFGGVRDYLRNVVEEARAQGYTQTIFGRRRYLPDLQSDNRQRREMAERMALNAPIQGSAADIVKAAMIGIHDALRERQCQSRLLLQVHDEVVLEVVAAEREQVAELVTQHMHDAAKLTVPLDVSLGWGSSWHDAGH